MHGLSYFLFSQAKPFWLAMVSSSGCRASALAVSAILNQTQLLRHVADGYRGRVFSTIESMTWGTMMFSMTAGAASEFYPVRAIASAAGVLSGSTSLFWALADWRGKIPEPPPRPNNMDEPFELKGKRVLVTGAARRIGGVALALAREGARVAIHYGSSREEAQATAAECEQLSGQPALLLRARLEHVGEIAAMFDAIEAQWGGLDALVNNAARFARRNVFEITESDWDEVHAVNLKAAFFCAQHAARLMRKAGVPGRIVNMSSLGGLQAWAEHVHYNASKAGLIHMTRALAKALAPDITVNSVAPGFIPFDDRDYSQTKEGPVSQTPVRRAGRVEEVAEAVLFFLRSANYITGQTLAVDGGLSIR